MMNFSENVLRTMVKYRMQNNKKRHTFVSHLEFDIIPEYN